MKSPLLCYSSWPFSRSTHLSRSSRLYPTSQLWDLSYNTILTNLWSSVRILFKVSRRGLKNSFLRICQMPHCRNRRQRHFANNCRGSVIATSRCTCIWVKWSSWEIKKEIQRLLRMMHLGKDRSENFIFWKGWKCKRTIKQGRFRERLRNTDVSKW